MKILMAVLLLLLLAGLARSETISWDPSPDAETYEVFVRERGHSTWNPVGPAVANTSMVVTVPDPTKTYEYSVVGVSTCGVRSEYSDPVAYNRCTQTQVQKVQNIKVVK